MSESETRHIFIAGLKNAHAMEKQALSVMRPQVKRIENYPEIAEKLETHIIETEGQIERLELILTSLAEEPSSLKDFTLWVTGSMAALSHAAAADEILKNSMANFAFENLEIALASRRKFKRNCNITKESQPNLICRRGAPVSGASLRHCRHHRNYRY